MRNWADLGKLCVYANIWINADQIWTEISQMGQDLGNNLYKYYSECEKWISAV